MAEKQFILMSNPNAKSSMIFIPQIPMENPKRMIKYRHKKLNKTVFKLPVRR
jgi:hypothetical protein